MKILQYLLDNPALVAQTLSLMGTILGAVWSATYWFYRKAQKKIQPFLTLPAKVEALSKAQETTTAELAEVKVQLKAAGESRSALKALEDLVHSLKGELGIIKLKLENEREERGIDKIKFEKQIQELLRS